ncbi:hypothetical protein [Streptomonospora wellingtoniae]|uniref:NERD domain-containing protein n=1 Tax=Streptomonospora wellingtoniae TaxID=3075544 RepID=A0ABU2KMU1_9ACTN|nr:hypothetical protein [Streptomonospora sp. DSM 45055]MDT0300584.1 hypothetical protein [Streptomonospora sp. DSM 45055]
MSALVSAATGVMAAGFLDWRAGLLVAGLTALTYVLSGTVGRRVPRSGGLGPALRTLRARGYRLVPDGAARSVAVGPGGVFLLVATSRSASWHGPRGWRVGGAPAERLAQRLEEQAAGLDAAAAGGQAPRDSAAAPGPAPAVPAVAVVLVVGRRPESVVELGRVLLARPRPAVRHILARGDVLSAEQAEHVAERIGRYLDSA